MTHSLTAPFGAQSTASELVIGIDLTGRRAVVTGATGGLGRETARALASAGARGDRRGTHPGGRRHRAGDRRRDRQRPDAGRSAGPRRPAIASTAKRTFAALD